MNLALIGSFLGECVLPSVFTFAAMLYATRKERKAIANLTVENEILKEKSKRYYSVAFVDQELFGHLNRVADYQKVVSFYEEIWKLSVSERIGPVTMMTSETMNEASLTWVHIIFSSVDDAIMAKMMFSEHAIFALQQTE